MNETQENEIFRLLMNAQMTARDKPARVRVDSRRLFALQSACFLLDYLPGRDVESFVVVVLDRLLRRIGRVTEPLQVEYQGRVRGRVVWPATLKARYREDYDPSRYVCREIKREYDTPENQLLKFMVERIYESLRAIPRTVRNGFSCFPENPLVLHPTGDRIGRMEAALNNFRHNARLRSVTLPAHVTRLHLSRSEISRMTEYRDVAAIYLRYRRVMLESNWAEFASSMTSRVLPLPESGDEEGSIWIELIADLIALRAGREITEQSE